MLNKDDVFSAYWQDYCADMNTVSFSMQDDSADFYAQHLEGDRYRIITGSGQAELKLRVPGKHNVMNALAATAVTYSLGLSLTEIMTSLSSFENIQGRLTVKFTEAGTQVIDDTYNANPLSVAAAIDVLAGMQCSTILVLGDMAELGDDAESLHADIGKKAKQAGVGAE